MTRTPRTDLGHHGERLAADHLADDGLEVIARNWRLSAGELRGELDLVAVDRATNLLVICEVKTRRGEGFGGPLAAVTPRKQAKIRALAAAFLREAGLGYHTVRFDVVAVWLIPGTEPRVEHLAGAF
jgi:putative endonuclease